MTDEEFQLWVPWGIYQAIIAAGMRGAILQDEEHSHLVEVARSLRSRNQDEIQEELVRHLHVMQPYNPAEHFNR